MTLRSLSKVDGSGQTEGRRGHRNRSGNGSVPVGDWPGGRPHSKNLTPIRNLKMTT
jgi:hypothetical protein